MIVKVFSLYDSKAKMFGPPFFMQTRGMAVRALSDLVKDSQSMVCRHPDDFVMYQIGEFNDQDAVFKNQNPHELVSMASDFKKETPVQLPLSLNGLDEVKEKVH